MTAPLSLVPLPRSVTWSSGTWETTDPWGELSVGISEDLPRTEHSLSISPRGAALTAGSEASLADGRNTFAQIVTGAQGSIPCVSIHDYPENAWRGLHLDVARHFFEIDQIEKVIDAMALHRLNVLHLHLTDDQGWRVEIKGYPRLTEVGAWRDQTLVGHMSGDPEDFEFDGIRHGGSYSQSQLRDLVEYARRRGVMIVPEIDLPGHMQAAIASYPELGNTPEVQVGVRQVWGVSDHVLGVSDAAFAFVRDVLTQIAEIFPSPYVHIGGDECPRTEWEHSVSARTRMQEWGLTRVSEIQGRFTTFAAEVLQEQDRRVIAWDEVLESHLPDGTIIMNGREASGVSEALRRGFQTIVATSDVLSFDHYQSSPSHEPLAIGGRTTLKDVYEAPLTPKKLDDEGRSLILGIQGQLWTEYISTPEQMEYMLFPRLCALAERAWGSPQSGWSDFEERLRGHLPRLEAFGISYRPLD